MSRFFGGDLVVLPDYTFMAKSMYSAVLIIMT